MFIYNNVKKKKKKKTTKWLYKDVEHQAISYTTGVPVRDCHFSSSVANGWIAMSSNMEQLNSRPVPLKQPCLRSALRIGMFKSQSLQLVYLLDPHFEVLLVFALVALVHRAHIYVCKPARCPRSDKVKAYEFHSKSYDWRERIITSRCCCVGLFDYHVPSWTRGVSKVQYAKQRTKNALFHDQRRQVDCEFRDS